MELRRQCRHLVWCHLTLGCLAVSSPLGFEALEALLQWRPITLPSERAWLVVGQGLGETQTLCAGLYAGKVMWRTNLPWEDRAVDCHLIEPTGMAGGGTTLMVRAAGRGRGPGCDDRGYGPGGSLSPQH